MKSLVFLATLLLAAPMAQAQVYDVSVPSTKASSGKWTVVNTHTRWKEECAFRLYPVVRNAKATHGQVRSRNGVKVRLTGKVLVGSIEQKCVGRVIDGVAVEYLPNPGFKGKDTITYVVDFKRQGDKPVPRKIVVTVR